AEGALARLGERLAEMAAPEDSPEPEGLVATLRGYQRRGLTWLVGMCELGLGGCLADDMGLGKTIQVIALHLARGRGPMLVVCPASLLGNWARELGVFAPSIAVRRYHGEGRNLDDLAPTEVVLATYGVARHDRAALAGVPWDLVVADEAQHMKNPQSRTARELRGIPAHARLALTGTPVENRLLDLWSILDWTTPGLLGPLETFRRRIAAPIEQEGDAATAARFGRLVRPFLLRRTKRDPDVAPELPAKTELDVLVPLTAEQASLYEAVVRETLAKIGGSEGIRRRGLVLELLTKLKQICNHPAHFLRETAPLRGRSGKLDALDELLEVIVAEGESALVFTQYVAMARLLEAHLVEQGIPTLFLHGGVEVRRRDALVRRFQDGEAPVFLLSLRAGGVGLNLTRATHVVHYDRWWNPAVEDQATDRAHRIGQDRPVQVHRLVAEGTVEDRIAALLRSKRALAEMVVGAGEEWL
ncbi:MAG: DEAD/DEAH box helicase, partial [Candidatus Dormibacteria bacterium]